MKKLLLGLFIGITLICLSGCGKITEPFSISCISVENVSGVRQTNKALYNFDTDKFVTDYEITTISMYDDEEMYKYYKESSEETVRLDTSPIVYTVIGDDVTNTLTLSYKISINKSDLDEVEDKTYYQAPSVLKRATEAGGSCEVIGIDKNKIK